MDISKNLYQYISESIKLAKSMHIYLDSLKIQSRIMVYKLYGYIPDDTDNKYILNCSGLMSDIDNPVYVTTDNGKEILTRNLINENNLIKEKILKFGNYYHALVDNNRLMATYIKGCLSSNTIEDTLNARDGQILWYNKNLLKNDRTQVIKAVQNFIYDFLDIYHNKDYVVDELYTGGLVSNLYSVLPTVILVEKLKNVFTSIADDFHIFNFFKSYKHLDKEISVLDKKTLIWLYGNLKYMRKNIGKNEILDMLINNVLTPSNIGIGRVYVEKSLPILNNNVDDIKSVFYTREIKAKESRLNIPFVFNNGKTFNIEEIIEKESIQDYIVDSNLVKIESTMTESKMKYSLPTKELSKVLAIDDIYLININDINKFCYFVNTLIYQTNISNNEFTINFLNPVDGIVYKLSSKQVLVLFLYLIGKIFSGLNDYDVFTLNYANVLDIKKAKNFNIEDYKLNDDEKELVEEILKDLTYLPSNINTLESYKLYFNISYKILNKFWYYLSNVSDIIYSTDLLFVINNLFSSGTSNLIYNKYIKELVQEVELPIKDIPNDVALYVFKRLLETITGDIIYETDRIKDILEKIIDIGKKFTSYTVQFLFSNDLSYVLTGHYQTLKNSVGKKSYISVNEAEFTYYDKVKKEIVNKFLPIKEFMLNKNIANTFRLKRSYKLKIINVDKANMVMSADNIVRFKREDKMPDFYRPSTDTIQAKERIIDNNINRNIYYILPYKPNLINTNNVFTIGSRLKHSDKEDRLASYTPSILNYNPLYNKLDTYDNINNLNIVKFTKPIVKNISEIYNVNEQLMKDKIGLFSPNTDSKSKTEYLSVNELETEQHKEVRNPTITNYDNIIGGYSRINDENIKLYSPGIMKDPKPIVKDNDVDNSVKATYAPAPTVRTSTKDEVSDIPVIKIER